MSLKPVAAVLVGLLTLLKDPPPRDERGLSQSAETAIIVAGAVAVATIAVTLITVFVRSKLAGL